MYLLFVWEKTQLLITIEHIQIRSIPLHMQAETKAYWPKIAVILDAEEGYKDDTKHREKRRLRTSMGRRWSEVQILSPRPIFPGCFPVTQVTLDQV